ncbi:trypsin-like serine protease [Streptomyces sp. NPDC058239]|uniref:trypsin-like serine protease n=1 Tax=Streptomyces sp. NPDC058239 TaxID=3346395 RepID=UPI0036E716D5
MEFDRIVQVRVGRPESPGRASLATGYLVAPRLALTAAHVLGGRPLRGEGPVTVCRPEAGEQRFKATVVWERNDRTIDAALIEVDHNGGWQPPDCLLDVRTRPPQRWGHLIGPRPHPVIVCGFARMQKEVTGRREEQLTGHVHPGTGRSASRYEILSTNPTLPWTPTGGSTTKWSGISGAALLCGDLLIGVVAQDRQATDGTRLTATRAPDLLADDEFRSIVSRYSGWQPLLEPVEPDHLLAPAACARDLRSPAMLLRADTEAVAFYGRTHELHCLLDWCQNGPDTFEVRALVGAGGQGKTRLARHLAGVLRGAGWVAAQLRADLADTPEGPSPDWSTLDTAEPLLLIVDYAETLPRQIRRLIEHLRRTRHRTRLLLIARGEGEWKSEAFGAGPDTREILATAPTDELSPLNACSGDYGTRTSAFTRAARDLGQLLGQVPGLPQADWSALALSLRPPEDLNDARYESALALQMAALVALLQHGPDPVEGAPDRPVEDFVLGHEARYWEGTAASPMFRLGDLRPSTLRRAVAVAALFGAATTQEALTVLRDVPGLPPNREWDVAEWLQSLYPPSPGRYWGHLQPDRLAERHVTTHLTRSVDQDRTVLTGLWAHASGDQQLRAITVLSRAAVSPVESHRLTSVAEAFTVLQTILKDAPPAPRVLLDATVALPYPTRSDAIASLDLLLHYHLVIAYRDLATASPGTYGFDFVVLLNDLSARFHQLRMRSHAVTLLEKAVVTGRRLVHADPDSTRPALALALSNLADALAHMDQHKKALAPAEESVGEERRLLRADPNGDESYLALALYRLSKCLKLAGHKEKGVQVAQEAVAVYRRVARVNPDYEPSLARALTSLDIQLDDLGRQEESFAAWRESLAIRDRAGTLQSFEPSAGLGRKWARDSTTIRDRAGTLQSFEPSAGLGHVSSRDQ